jgi:hypothetical protein
MIFMLAVETPGKVIALLALCFFGPGTGYQNCTLQVKQLFALLV